VRARTFIRNLDRAPIGTAFALLAVITGIRGVFDPTSLAVYYTLPVLSYVWAVVYGIGGLLMLWGAGRLNPKWEAAGCILIAGGTGVQAILFLSELGSFRFITIWNVVSLGIFTAAFLRRAVHLVRGQHLIWVKTVSHGD